MGVFEIDAAAVTIAELDDVHFLADYDAVPYGEENVRTAHFGWSGKDKTGEMISVCTSSVNDGWEITITDASNASKSTTFEFRDGILFESVNNGESYDVRQGDDEIPSSFLSLVASSRDVGLASFDFTGSDVQAVILSH